MKIVVFFFQRIMPYALSSRIKHDEVQFQPDGCLELLAVHHELTVAADRQHPAGGVEHRGHHCRRAGGRHCRHGVIEQTARPPRARTSSRANQILVHAVVESDSMPSSGMTLRTSRTIRCGVGGNRALSLRSVMRARIPCRSRSSGDFGDSRPSRRSARSVRLGPTSPSPRHPGSRPARLRRAYSRRG